jgi:signal transduction histidine kinase
VLPRPSAKHQPGRSGAGRARIYRPAASAGHHIEHLMQSEDRASVEAAEAARATVLVVEDNEWVQNYVSRIFRESHEIILAGDGLEALDHLERITPDLIILDLIMPRMDGTELFERLKENKKWRNIPVIMFSAMSDEEHKLEGLEAGADDYIAKPFNPRELRARVRNLIQLRAQERELERLNTNLETRVQTQVAMILAERRRYERELVGARDRAEASDRLKGFILRNMSHEIRTPITNILGFAEILAERVQGEDVQFTRYIQSNGKRLLDTVMAILDFSELATESFKLTPSDVSLSEVINDAAARYEEAAREKRLILHVDVADSGHRVYFDRSAIDRILNHLIGNAIKFTSRGGVAVRAACDANKVMIEVEDTGVGIAESFRDQLYAPFTQESEGDSRSFEGTGLGLAICKGLVELMGGAIAVKSQKGSGSTFTLTFPQRRDRAAVQSNTAGRNSTPAATERK